MIVPKAYEIKTKLSSTDLRLIKKSMRKRMSWLDHKITPILKKINRSDKVATSYSCEGHASELDFVEDNSGNIISVTNNNNAYLTIHCTPANFIKIKKYLHFLNTHKKMKVSFSTVYTSSNKNGRYRMGATICMAFHSKICKDSWDHHFWTFLHKFINRIL